MAGGKEEGCRGHMKMQRELGEGTHRAPRAAHVEKWDLTEGSI